MATRGWEGVTSRTRGRGSKFHNVPTTVNGQRFDSQREATYYAGLEARAAAGEITSLRRQVAFPLLCPFEDRTVYVCSYVADFVYVERGVRHVVDAKGHRTPMFTLKARWLYLQDGIVIEEV